MRTGESGRTRISEADSQEEVHTIGVRGAIGVPSDEAAAETPVHETRDLAAAEADVAYRPRMPHNELGRAELDVAYPRLEAPDELDLNDLMRLEDDGLYKAGMEVVNGILAEMAEHGRVRRVNPVAKTEASGGRPPQP